jgi:glycosyltransferase involved in cell wall biosynthesis
MRILYDYQIFCLQQYGGISRYFYELANHIAALVEHSVEIFAPFYTCQYLTARGVATHKGRKIPKLSGLEKVTAWSIDAALAYLLSSSQSGVDVFHATYYSGVDCCTRSSKKIITVHDMIYEKFSDQFPGKDKMRQMKKNAIIRADHIICVSDNTRRDLLNLLPVPENKTSVIYHGSSFYKKTKNKSFPIRKPYLLFIGQRDGYKNFDILLRAFAHSSKLRKDFLLICFGGGTFSSVERKRIATLGLSLQDVIHVRGDDADLAGFYGEAAAFVYPSLYEGFGIPLLEAMALSCPVVCSNASSFPEVVGNAADLFDPFDEESLRSTIERVVFSMEHRDFLIGRGLDRARLFSWDRCAEETLQVYAN